MLSPEVAGRPKTKLSWRRQFEKLGRKLESIFVSTKCWVFSRLYSHAAGGYWKLPRAAISRDQKYVIFDSDYGQDHPVDEYADVYLIPLTLERFRLATGAPVFADRKSIPYRDVEVVEWYERFMVARDLYLTHDPDLACAAVGQLARRYQVTHVVLAREQTGQRCGVLRTLYEDADYGVYRVIRG